MQKVKLSPNFSRSTNRRFRALIPEYQWLIYEDIKDAFESRLKFFERLMKKRA